MVINIRFLNLSGFINGLHAPLQLIHNLNMQASNVRMALPDIVGMVGVALELWFYMLLHLGKCAAQSLSFSLGNFIGSGLILISLVFCWNFPSFVIEVIWFLISLYGVCKCMTKWFRKVDGFNNIPPSH